MRMSLNLASRPYSDLGPAVRRLRVAFVALALLCIVLGFGVRQLHRQADMARGRERALDTEIARTNAERAGYQRMMTEPANAQLLAQSATLNELFDVKSFSWTLAMEALETVLPAGVQVSSIEPVRDKNGQIELHLRVAGPRDHADEFVANLEHSRRFFQPRIVGENSEASSGANQRIEPVSASNRFNFDLVTQYNPPTREEALGASAAEVQTPAENLAAQKSKTAAPLSKSAVPAAGFVRPAAVAQPAATKQQRPAAATPLTARPKSPLNGARASSMTGLPQRTPGAAPIQQAASTAAQGGAK
jgi:type IV pilus assembly protein PilN